MAFSWETPTRTRSSSLSGGAGGSGGANGSGAGAGRVGMYVRELTQRAGLFYRLGYPPSRAIGRLCANAKWDFELGCGERPNELSDDAIADLVKTTYLRRPTR